MRRRLSVVGLALTALLLAGAALEASAGHRADERGVMAMPTAWTEEAAARLAAQGLTTPAQARSTAWAETVTYREANAVLARAAGKGVQKMRSLHAPADALLTRLAFVRLLDRFIGSPALFGYPPEAKLGAREREPFGDFLSADQLAHPEQLEVYDDVSTPEDRALVNRLAWWLILRVPQSEQPKSFGPDRAVTWGEFIVCLDRAVRFLSPPPVDTATPRGSFEAWQNAFWHANWKEVDRYALPGLRDPGTGLDFQLLTRLSRFNFEVAQDLVDLRITKVATSSPKHVRLTADLPASSEGVNRPRFGMVQRGAHWWFSDFPQ